MLCLPSLVDSLMPPLDASVHAVPKTFSWRLLALLLFARTALDTGFRAVYPFLPFIASNLGVSVASAAQIVQARNLLGFAAPLFGPLTDRYGRRVMMLAGLAIMAATGLLLYFVTSLWMAIVVMTLMGLSSILYVPAQQAYLGDQVPYARRGRIMAIAEIAWSLAAIIGLPLMGFVVQTRGWRASFVAVGMVALGALALLWFALPRDKPNASHAARAMGKAYWEALRAPMALAVIVTTFLSAAMNENINIVFADWLNRAFGMDAVALGIVAAAIGGAEFVAQMMVALFVDRIGKWKMVAGGLVLGVGAYLLLPFLGATAWSGGAGVVLTFFAFELTIVAALPLITEIAPNARATLLSLGVAGFSLGRAAGSFIGPLVYARFGFGVASFVSASGILLACVIWFMFVREKQAEVIAT
ncbi:MAG: hypothetical protein B6D41_22515 [Chloroflexi bacterium UTCFX4]|nr:MAG: hypothetical protein B6D41_22515 [Chloroflexi bacterium UTCFX4]